MSTSNHNPKNHLTKKFKLQSIENETIEKYEESQFKMEKSIKTWGESTSLTKKSHSWQ